MPHRSFLRDIALQILSVSSASFPCISVLPLAIYPAGICQSTAPDWWPPREGSLPTHLLSLALLLLSWCLRHHHTGHSSPGSHTCAKSIRPSICLSVCISSHLSVHPSVRHPSFHLSTCPSFIHAPIHPPSIHSDASSIQPRPEFAKAKFNLQLLRLMLDIFSEETEAAELEASTGCWPELTPVLWVELSIQAVLRT